MVGRAHLTDSDKLLSFPQNPFRRQQREEQSQHDRAVPERDGRVGFEGDHLGAGRLWSTSAGVAAGVKKRPRDVLAARVSSGSFMGTCSNSPAGGSTRKPAVGIPPSRAGGGKSLTS